MPEKYPPYDENLFADTKYADEVFLLSKAQFKSEIAMHCKPLEDAFFEKGRLRGLAEADQKQREQLTVKVAGLVPNTARANSGTDPVALAKRAAELVEAAEAKGEELTHLQSVRLAYQQAGVPIS